MRAPYELPIGTQRQPKIDPDGGPDPVSPQPHNVNQRARGTERTPSRLAAGVVTASDIQRRVHAHARDSYTVLYSVMKGVSVAAGVTALIAIVGGPPEHLARIPLLVASFLAVVLTYVAATVGSNLLPGRLSVLDAILPVALTVFEAGPLVLLASGDQGPDTRFVIHAWMLGMAVFNVIAFALLRWVMRRLDNDLYDQPAKEIVGTYRRGLEADCRAAGAGAVLLLTIFIVAVASDHALSTWTEASVAGVAASIIFAIGLITQQKSAEHMQKGIAEAVSQAAERRLLVGDRERSGACGLRD
jgi:hypothetical protein